MEGRIKKHIHILLAAFTASAVIFLVNGLIPSFLNGFPEGINTDLSRLWFSNRAEELFHIRYADSEYGRRILVLGLQKAGYAIGIPYQLSFNLINFLANFFFLYFAIELGRMRYKQLNPWLFAGFVGLSFPVLFAYLPVIFTYDDTLQFALLSGFMFYLFKGKQAATYLCFFLACLSRETSLVFAVFLLIYFWKEGSDIRSFLSAILPYGLLALAYLFILYWRMDSSMLERSSDFMLGQRFFAYEDNFADIHKVVEAFLYIAAVYLLPFIVLRRSWGRVRGSSVFQAALGLIIVNLLLCFVSSLATEARLYTMTLIPLFPLLAKPLSAIYEDLKSQKGIYPLSIGLSIMLSACLIALYRPEVERAFYVFAPYLFLYFSFCFYLIFKKRFNPR